MIFCIFSQFFSLQMDENGVNLENAFDDFSQISVFILFMIFCIFSQYFQLQRGENGLNFQ